MWNSPHSFSKGGTRYELADLSALILPLYRMFDQSKSMPVRDIVEEMILKRLERNEFVFALYQLFEALLEEVPIPEKGHTGIQEAMIAELLYQSYTLVVCELEMNEFGHSARKAVWNSVDRLLIRRNPNSPELPWILEDAGLTLSDPDPYLSEKLTREIWEELLLDECFLCGEFLWDDDWRLDSLMDADPNIATEVSQLAGLDLAVVQSLAHTPSESELRMAEHYLKYVYWKDEVLTSR